ncbi:cation:proton antiporter [Actinosynnema pretiosum subsp. pretiosum]|uniref:Cation:proton antiporter n=1 Tax=Actinosynnema pretiosum subsp. pretiosum TaxID=103721 RepID=A0AA45L9K4_9PSEU|nr:cation:proton antiporter [Actinosynnema mirum]QUF05293.1 cation:proton antiporter [Actinosynnema pretiosum subsp. pretiosum]
MGAPGGGEGLSASVAAPAGDSLVALLFLDLAVVLALGALLGALARRLGQPSVVGEVAAGIALGPSLLGLLPGDPVALLFPPEARPPLAFAAQLGLVLFMFLVGCELDVAELRGAGRVVGAVSAGSVVLPFCLGLGVAALLWPRGGDALALFTAAALSITAFPVLARILAERRMQRTRSGVVALASAAVNDVVAWCALAVVAGIVTARGPWSAVATLAWTAALVLVAVLLVRPLVGWAARAVGGSPRADAVLFAVVVQGLLLFALATTAIGLHAVFGAFLFGAVVPKDALREAAPTLVDRVGGLSSLLLPVFFVVAGLSVDVGGLGWSGAGEALLVLVAACVGKLVGAAGGGLLAGLPARDAAEVGVLMNARGLTELVVLGVGLELGVLDGHLFTVLVVMALVTTAATGPLLTLIARRSGREASALGGVR